MSNSYKKSPVSSWCSTKSQKSWQSKEHRRYRSNVRDTLRALCKALGDDLSETHYETLRYTLIGRVEALRSFDRRFGNEWASPRDGTFYHSWKYLKEWYTKEEYRDLIRK